MAVSKKFDLEKTEAFEKLKKLVEEQRQREPSEAGRNYRNFERELQERSRALEREIHEELLRELDIKAAGVVFGEKRYRYEGEWEGEYLMMAGPVRVKRTVYRERGGHGGETLIPLELSAGIVDGYWSPYAAESASRYVEAVPARRVSALLECHRGMQPSPATVDRLPKAFNVLWEAQRERFEGLVREDDELPAAEDVAAVAFSLDGVMLPMKYAPRSLEPDGAQGYQEAGCGTVFLLGHNGERLFTAKVARMPESKKPTLNRALEGELRRMKLRYPRATFLAVADGADENWRIISELGAKVGVMVRRVLDFYHLMEHLDVVFKAAYGEKSPKVAEAHEHWAEALKTSVHAPRQLERHVESLKEHARGSWPKKEIERELKYIQKNHRDGRLAYATLLKHNLPIGSGVQEAACKTLVSERMKLSGMTWDRPGGQGIMTLRALEQSGRLSSAWRHLGTRLQRQVLIDPDTSRLRASRPRAD